MIGNVKHFAVNNQEGQGASFPGAPVGAGVQGSRLTVDERVDERTLREIYLPHFEAAVKEAGVGSVMCSYPRVNGQYACENKHLLEILKRDWGFQGYVLADYGAAKNTADSLVNGLDFDPWPGFAHGPTQVNAAMAGSPAAAGVARRPHPPHPAHLLRARLLRPRGLPLRRQQDRQAGPRPHRPARSRSPASC